MWKWIVGVLLLLVLLAGGTCYRVYRKVVGAGDSARITVAATPEHVFDALADVDSMVAWGGAGFSAAPTGRGRLAPGDSVRMIQVVPRAGEAEGVTDSSLWVVRAVDASVRIIMDRIQFDSLGQAYVSMRWQDSVIPMGDSTAVLRTVSIPDENLPSRRSGVDSSGTMRVADKLYLGVARAMAEFRLNRLERYLQEAGTP